MNGTPLQAVRAGANGGQPSGGMPNQLQLLTELIIVARTGLMIVSAPSIFPFYIFIYTTNIYTNIS